MKIVSWNCNGSFRTKFKQIEKLDADIYIIQECENPLNTKSDDYKKFATNYTYIEHSQHKGLGIFAKDNIKIETNNWNSYGLECFESIKINDNLNIVGVWCCCNYIEDYFVYQEIHKEKFNEKTIIMGDFNSSSLWDNKHGKRTHSKVVNYLKEIGLESVYHYLNKEEQGKETISTFYLYKHLDRPYHIDYCFANPNIIKDFKILNDDWLQYSDHIPLVLEI